MPPVGEPSREFDRLRTHPADVDRGRRLGGVTPQSKAVEFEAVAVVSHRLTREHLSDDVDVLPRASEWAVEVDAVPPLDDCRAARSDADAEPSPRRFLKGRRGLSEKGRRPRVDVEQTRPESDTLCSLGQHGECRHGVPPPRLGGPDALVAEFLSLNADVDETVERGLGGDRKVDSEGRVFAGGHRLSSSSVSGHGHSTTGSPPACS